METQPKKDNDLTLDILTEFIEVLIHQVLHMRYNPPFFTLTDFETDQVWSKGPLPSIHIQKAQEVQHATTNVNPGVFQLSCTLHTVCKNISKSILHCLSIFIVYMPFVYIKSEEPSPNDLLFVGSPG